MVCGPPFSDYNVALYLKKKKKSYHKRLPNFGSVSLP